MEKRRLAEEEEAKGQGRTSSFVSLLIWYILFGGLHELAHFACAALLLGDNDRVILGPSANDYNNDENGSWSSPFSILYFLSQVFFSRAISIPALERVNDDDKGNIFFIVRHAGWIFSTLMAILMTSLVAILHKNKQNNKANMTNSLFSSHSSFLLHQASVAAWITCLEAVCTDLLGLGVPTTGTRSIFFCGNFGVILINNAWIQNDGGKTALQLLKKMVEITMMRGAQTGGVLAWVSRQEERDLYSIRSRVVNAKRTDLSEGITNRVYKDCFEGGRIKSGIRGFYGHTRFATSSKATLEGTHPHQWSPGYQWRVYLPHQLKLRIDKNTNGIAPKPRRINVENFITHNGDLDFFRVGTTFYDLHTIQQWLIKATGAPMPCIVDSAAIAGLVDIIRTAGSFGLSARFALLMGGSCCRADPQSIPHNEDFETIGKIFEPHLARLCKEYSMSILELSDHDKFRDLLVSKALKDVISVLKHPTLRRYFSFSVDDDDEEQQLGTNHLMDPLEFTRATVNAFFDNDLMHTTRMFLENAKGSFGLMITSSLDARRQICIAARGQTMSVAFYPNQGLVCYGSEQAAVKAGLDFDVTGPNALFQAAPSFLNMSPSDRSSFYDETVRLDLDDLGGEICLMDWGNDNIDDNLFVSKPNRHHKVHRVVLGAMRIILHQESAINQDPLHRRMTRLEGNHLIRPLPQSNSKNDNNDLILQDICDIPHVCKSIQDDWQSKGLNRMTAWHLGRCIQKRLNDRISGRVSARSDTVDILLTGCEVSLWLAEQFASDLKKSFPNLGVQAISSNKLLGVFGQELAVPSIGYPLSESTHKLEHAIVIIVSHSGGTFAPLACSNLLQSKTDKIFVVASEWDTQIGKQLRSLSDDWCSRIFTTEVGVRTAEPCSVSVAATQQLLTLIFEHICFTILAKKKFRRETGAVITETDLKILERCNTDNIVALEQIVGTTTNNNDASLPEKELRAVGKQWSNHILENAKSYIGAIIYIVVTVTIGYPIVTGLTIAIFGDDPGDSFFLSRFFDSLIYLFLPQINIFLLRLIEKRDLRHRTAGRTVVIGDIPWVSQCADAFLSKIFACSYSIAGLNVLSGNPSDHLVHRHTHRIVRGTLLVCGRPDGRLSALASKEATVCLSVNQASSIQSIGGTCESITIGHNPSSLSLTKSDVILPSSRPRFLCEELLAENNIKQQFGGGEKRQDSVRRKSMIDDKEQSSDPQERKDLPRNTSPHYLLGLYSGWKRAELSSRLEHSSDRITHQEAVIERMIHQKHDRDTAKRAFHSVSTGDKVGLFEFKRAYRRVSSLMDEKALTKLFDENTDEANSQLDMKDFVAIAEKPATNVLRELDNVGREEEDIGKGIKCSNETYFGEEARKWAPKGFSEFTLCERQNLAMELYESRIASLQRFVAMTVMFHEIGKNVERFFERISFGLLGYRMDRTHSIMRIATTASPVSGADVRERMETLQLEKTIRRSINVISSSWYNYSNKEGKALRRLNSSRKLLIGQSTRKLRLSRIGSALSHLPEDTGIEEENGEGSSDQFTSFADETSDNSIPVVLGFDEGDSTDTSAEMEV